MSGPDTKKLKIPVFFQTKKYKKIQKNTKKYLKIWVPDKRLISSKTGSVYACVPLRNIFSFNFMHLGFLKVLIYELSGAADRRTPDRIYEKVHVLETWKSKQSCKTSLIQITFFLVGNFDSRNFLSKKWAIGDTMNSVCYGLGRLGGLLRRR